MFSCGFTPRLSNAFDTVLTFCENWFHEYDFHVLPPKSLYIRASRSPYFFAWLCTRTDKWFFVCIMFLFLWQWRHSHAERLLPASVFAKIIKIFQTLQLMLCFCPSIRKIVRFRPCFLAFFHFYRFASGCSSRRYSCESLSSRQASRIWLSVLRLFSIAPA